MTMLALVFGLPGLWLAITAFAPRRPPEPPALPPAQIADGRPVRLPRESVGVRGWRLGCGVVLIAFGVLGGWFLYALGQGFDLKLGRPLRVRGRVRLPRRRRGSGGDDGTRPRLAGLGLWRRAMLGERWHAAARAEHASIAAFDEIAEQLRLAGAGSELVERCRSAARDEARHASRCYALARQYSGIAWCAGEMPDRAQAPNELVTLAAESFVDGCLGEAISAAIARRGAELATDPAIASSLAMIAGDEARHAELGWAIVDGCIALGGEPALQAVRDAAGTRPRTASRGPTDVPRRERAAITARVHAAARAELARRWTT